MADEQEEGVNAMTVTLHEGIETFTNDQDFGGPTFVRTSPGKVEKDYLMRLMGPIHYEMALITGVVTEDG